MNIIKVGKFVPKPRIFVNNFLTTRSHKPSFRKHGCEVSKSQEDVNNNNKQEEHNKRAKLTHYVLKCVINDNVQRKTHLVRSMRTNVPNMQTIIT